MTLSVGCHALTMTFQRRHEVIHRVATFVLADLDRQAFPTYLQEYVLDRIISIDSSLVQREKYTDTPIDRHALNMHAEPELNKMYNIVTSDFFYTNASSGCRILCMSNLGHVMFQKHESYGL
jgi:hypothetical protein